MDIYFDGIETTSDLENLLLAGCRHYCLSHAFLSKNNTDSIISKINDLGGSIFLLSSLPDAEDEHTECSYITDYLQFIKKYKANLHLIEEPQVKHYADVRSDMLVSECTLVARFSGVMSASAEDSFLGVDVIGLALDTKKPALFNDVINFGSFKQAGVLFHGWNVSLVSLLCDIPFASVSTDAWKYGSKLGVVYKYSPGMDLVRVADGTHTNAKKKEGIKRKLRSAVEAHNLDFQKFLDDDKDTLDIWNALQWKQFAKEAVDAKFDREYWHTEAEKRKRITAKREEHGLATLTPTETPLALPLNEDKRVLVKRQCNTCNIKEYCPYFEFDAECKVSNPSLITSEENAKVAFGEILSVSRDRLLHRSMQEKLTGVEDELLTTDMESYSRTLKNFVDIVAPKASLSFRAEGGGVGILGALLANMGGGAKDGHQQGQRAEVKAAVKIAREEAIRDIQRDTEIIEAEFENTPTEVEDEDRSSEED